MPQISWTEETAASGLLAEVYINYMKQSGQSQVADILKCFSHRPDFLQDVIDFSNRVHFSHGHLKRRVKEMLATYVSALNKCKY